MYRLLLAVAALALTAGPAFAQSQDLAQPGKGPLLEYKGAQASLSDAQRLVLLYDNGPIQTGTGNGAGGANTSAIQSSYGSTLFGSGHNAAAASPVYVADDFTVPAGGWTLSDIDFFSYQTGSTATTSTFTNVFAQIWNGRPGDPGSAVVFGDLTTNRLGSSTFSTIYRVQEATLTNAQRPIFRNNVAIGTTLPAGTYWVQWGSTGSLASGPWVPPVTTAGTATPPPGNARQFINGAWADALDGTFVVALPFVLNGTAGAPAGPTISAAPGALAFGTVTVGTTTAPQTVTLTNSGIGTLTIASITGSGAPFTVNTSGTSLSLAAGASTTFTVTYSPTAATASTGAVTITSNAPSSPTTISLSGTGNADVTSTIPAGTTIGGPTWARPTTVGTGASGSCAVSTTFNAVAYQTVPFTVATAGAYTVTTNYSGPPPFDGFIFLYRGAFNPADPCLNLVALDDDFGSPALENSQIAGSALVAGGYTLVVTGYDNAEAGAYTGTVVGPSAVTFGGAPTPSLSVTPSAVAFGAVAVGATATQNVTITNTGGTTINLASVTYTGNASITASAVAPGALAPGATRTTTLTFAPTAVGAVTGTLTVTSDAPGSPVAVAISGTGTNATPPVVTSFCSGTLTNIPGGQPATTIGPFDPYPNTITVTGITRPVVDVNVRLVGMDHTFPADLDIFVEHPLGPTAILMSDVGGGGDVVGVTFTIDDEAAAAFPATALSTGSYRPTDLVAGDAYPAPAPAPSGTSLAVFDGANPNGAWKLYGVDDAGGDVGTIADVCLDISVTNPVADEGSPTARTFLTAAPNPAHSAARVRFGAATAQDVTVAVFDVTGRQVATLFSGAVAADQTLDLRLDAAALPSGVYIVRATGASVNLTQRVTVVR